jgi:non-specific serine/threonine protein kinase
MDPERLIGLIVVVDMGIGSTGTSSVPGEPRPLILAVGEAVRAILARAGPDGVPESGQAHDRAPATFRREGDHWALGMGDTIRMRDAKGMRYLAALISRSGRELHALDLLRLDVPGGPGAVGVGEASALGLQIERAGSVDDMLDSVARAAYRDRIVELRAESDAARRDHDEGRIGRAESEIGHLTDALCAAYGLGGRARPSASAAERARQSVTKAIRSALSRIEHAEPVLGGHLARTVRTGQYCCYDPDPAAIPEWHL